METSTKKKLFYYLWLAIGGILMLFIGAQYNIVYAAWIAPLFIMRFVRNYKKWYEILFAFVFLSVLGTVPILGAWPLPFYLIIVFSAFIKVIPLLVCLLLDRIVHRKLGNIVLATLIFPSSFVAIYYLYSKLMVTSTTFAMSNSQFALAPLSQFASVAGLWGILFLISWFPVIVNNIWEDVRSIDSWKKQIILFSSILIIILFTGGVRIYLSDDRDAETVKIGSVSVAHESDYWEDIIDLETPPDAAVEYADEMKKLENELFELSKIAVAGGAEIVFWCEGAAAMFEDQEAEFLLRAQEFASENEIYFMPGMVVMRYGQVLNDNKCTMINPDGTIAFHYTKTWSYYPTESDGIIKTVDTPYGTIAAAICYDLDFPAWVRSETKDKGVDIMLDPAFDTKNIRPWHTEVSLFRAIENGFSLIRNCNKGASIAVDGYGKVLTYQDFFRTNPRIMYSDVPTERNNTFYKVFGDLPIILLCLIGILFPIIIAVRKKNKKDK